MTEKIINDFAFPREGDYQKGITMLDYFAAHALQGIAQAYTNKYELARDSYKLAEIMLEIRMEYMK